MYYTGIDLHKKTSFITTLNQAGKMVKRENLINDEKAILAYFQSLEQDSQIVPKSAIEF